MSPEEHFRRLKDDDVWQGTERPLAGALRPARATVARRERGPIVATAVVGVCVAVLAVAAIHFAAPATQGGSIGAAATTTSSAAATSEAPTPTPTPSPSSPELELYQFDPKSPSDMARAKTIIECFKSHGVKLVGLSPADADGIQYIGYGGVHNDQQSITTGLKYQDLCFAAGGKR